MFAAHIPTDSADSAARAAHAAARAAAIAAARARVAFARAAGIHAEPELDGLTPAALAYIDRTLGVAASFVAVAGQEAHGAHAAARAACAAADDGDVDYAGRCVDAAETAARCAWAAAEAVEANVDALEEAAHAAYR